MNCENAPIMAAGRACGAMRNVGGVGAPQDGVARSDMVAASRVARAWTAGECGMLRQDTVRGRGRYLAA